MKKFSFKRIAMMSLAAMMAISAMSMPALAADTDTEDTWQARMEAAEYGTVDSIDELVDAPIIYTINDDGEFVLEYENNGIMPFGRPTKPSTIAGATDTYLYGSGTSNPSQRIYVNKNAAFTFTFNSSCTTSTTQYAEFFVGATSTTQKIYFEGSGGTNTTVNITLEPVSSGASTLGPKDLPIKSSNYDSIYFKGLSVGKLYAVKITPKTAGKAVTGTVKLSNTDF